MSEEVEVLRCPNCGAEEIDSYCSRCGQAQEPLLPTAPEFFRRVTVELLDLDARWLRTIVALVRYPGRLTVDWINGHRASWTSPLRLYLVAAAVFFATIGLTNRMGRTESSFVASAAEGFLVGALGDAAGLEAEVVIAESLQLLPPAFLLLVPYGALLLALALHRHRRLYVEHLVTLVHVHAFAFASWTLVPLIRVGTQFDVGPLAAIWVVGYCHFAFRRVYRDLRWRELASIALAFFFYLATVALVLGSIGILRVGGLSA